MPDKERLITILLHTNIIMYTEFINDERNNVDCKDINIEHAIYRFSLLVYVIYTYTHTHTHIFAHILIY